MAKNMAIDDIASYGLFVALVGYGVLIVGLDFYNFSNREILTKASSQKTQMIKSQFALTLISYILIIPIMAIMLLNFGLNKNLILWFIFILIFEHLNQEIYRLLIVLEDQLYATFLLFIRQGLWAIIVIYEVLINDKIMLLDYVLGLWATTSFVCLIFGAIKLNRLSLLNFSQPVIWKYLYKGISVSFALFIGTIALRGIQALDRFWIALASNQDVVAAYVVYMSIAGALLAFLDAGIFSFSYPRLIKHHNNKNDKMFYSEFKTLIIQTFSTCVVFCLTAYLLSPLILEFLDKDEYSTNLSVLYWSLAFVSLFGISMIPHFALYAKRKDSAIIISHLFAAIVMAILFLVSRYWNFSTEEIFVCILLVNISMVGMKSFYLWTFTKVSLTADSLKKMELE